MFAPVDRFARTRCEHGFVVTRAHGFWRQERLHGSTKAVALGTARKAILCMDMCGAIVRRSIRSAAAIALDLISDLITF